MRHVLAALAMAAALAGEAGAQAPSLFFSNTEGHWTIYNQSGRCHAINRPLNEASATPFNALTLSEARGGPIIVTVGFWPGQVAAQGPGRLTLRLDNRPAITLAAKPVGDFGLETTEPLTAGFLQDLRTSRILDVDATGVRQGLTFDIERVAFVIARLETCARLLPQQ
jgi:hypothetical protein